MEIKKEDLIEGVTILQSKLNKNTNRMYLGCAGLVYFLSYKNDYSKFGVNYTLNDINQFFNIYKEPSKTVPLEKKVYDFVDVVCWDFENQNKLKCKLIAVLPKELYKILALTENGNWAAFKNAEFI